MRPVWAVVVAAGSGTRFGGAKQFATVAGKSCAAWAVQACRSAAEGVVVVLPAPQDAPAGEGGPWPSLDADAVVAGGATRSASVRAGLAAVPPEAQVVVIHDAARPLAPQEVFAAVIDAVQAGAQGAVPALRVSDTLKAVSEDPDGRLVVRRTVERQGLVAVQTPQAFLASSLRQAHAGCPEATDDAALVEAQGGTVVAVPGDPRAFKVTTRADLAYAEYLAGS